MPATDLDIVLDGTHFRLTEPLNYVNMATFPPKVTFGDYSKENHELLSSWVISDLSGGHGVAELNEGTEANRYRWADGLYCRYPNQITPPYRITKTTDGSGRAYYPLCDVYMSVNAAASDWYHYGIIGTNIIRNDTELTATVTGAPVNKGVAFQGSGSKPFLFIPLGSNGWATFDNSGSANGTVSTNTNLKVRGFTVWDNKIIALTTTGALYYAVEAAAGSTMNVATGDTHKYWKKYKGKSTVDAGYDVRDIIVYNNRNGEPAVHVVTNMDVWGFDAGGPRLFRTSLTFPRATSAGIGSCVWRGDLFVAAGMDIYRYNGDTVSNIGLSREDGLPYQYQGVITDLAAGPNGMYALVRGRASGSAYYWSIHEWSGTGWHTIWADLGPTTTSKTPTYVVCSFSKDDATRLWWGVGSQRFKQEMPAENTNPREHVENNGGIGFGMTGTSGQEYKLLTGRFDAGMKGFKKIANAVEVNIRTMPTTGQTLTIDYRIDGGSWTTLGVTTKAGRTLLRFGNPTATSPNVFTGASFHDIELRVVLKDETYVVSGTSDPTLISDGVISGSSITAENVNGSYLTSRSNTTPPAINATPPTTVIENIVFSFLKVRQASGSWVASIDLSQPWMDKSPEEMATKLDTLLQAGRFFQFQHRERNYRVRLAQVAGQDNLGFDERSMRRINIVEVPLTLGPL